MGERAEECDIVLIGGTGFIGSRLAVGFVEQGKSVISIGLTAKPGHPSPILTVDVADREALTHSFPKAKTVFILTGQNHHGFDPDHEMALLDNIIVVLNERQPAKVFYLSSALVYGERATPAKEDDPCQPIDAYSQFKVRGEMLLRETLDPAIALGILRLGNVYGTPENRGFIHWLMQAAGAEPASAKLVLNGDGTQARDYVFVDDVVAVLIALEEKLAHSDTVNIATGRSHTLREVVALAETVTGRPIPSTLNPAAPVEVHENRVSVEKLVTQYGSTLPHDLASGLQITWERYQSRLV